MATWSPLFANITMYERPEIRRSSGRFWQLLRRELGNAPPRMQPVAGDAHWLSPRLLLGQSCSLPFRTLLFRRVQIVGTLDYGLPGTAPGYYHSQIVVRRDDPVHDAPGASRHRAAVNDQLSQSGWAALLECLPHLQHRASPLLITGSHRASACAVAEGRADIAAIDAVTWRFLQRHDAPLTDRLRVLATSRPTPGLPLVTARGRDSSRLHKAVRRAVAALGSSGRARLGLRGVVFIPAYKYHALPVPWGVDETLRGMTGKSFRGD